MLNYQRVLLRASRASQGSYQMLPDATKKRHHPRCSEAVTIDQDTLIVDLTGILSTSTCGGQESDS